ncbi:hypothetical protein [Acinetobacter baylyi]|uniref:hypothetical protein n=1 Tax=Acinetobacter baylyi TaxID=202950 RepID=UPI001D18505F|nr:hypothetical protein [Acinetobacter baylyi]
MKMIKTRYIKYILIVLALLNIAACGIKMKVHDPAQIKGIFWQPDLDTTPPKGNWHLLGVNTFVPQWSIVDSKSWISEIDHTERWNKSISLSQLRKKLWAKNIILGTAGEYNEPKARQNVIALGAQAEKLIHQHLDVQGYYFPVEADPSWQQVHLLGKVLEKLPIPFWVSIYSGEANPSHYSLWVKSWLPEKDKVFFQDGVGTGVRTPQQALNIYNDLEKDLGKNRTAIVLEAFRPDHKGGFRSAYPWEIIQQLKAYEGKTVYIFDGPHYLNRTSVLIISLWYKVYYANSHPTKA